MAFLNFLKSSWNYLKAAWKWCLSIFFGATSIYNLPLQQPPLAFVHLRRLAHFEEGFRKAGVANMDEISFRFGTRDREMEAESTDENPEQELGGCSFQAHLRKGYILRIDHKNTGVPNTSRKLESVGVHRERLQWIHMYIYIYIIYTPGTCLSSIFGLQPSKTRSFPIKTGVIWVPGIYIYMPKWWSRCSWLASSKRIQALGISGNARWNEVKFAKRPHLLGSQTLIRLIGFRLPTKIYRIWIGGLIYVYIDIWRYTVIMYAEECMEYYCQHFEKL